MSLEGTKNDADKSFEESAELNRQNEVAMQENERRVKEEQPLTSEKVPLSDLDSKYQGSFHNFQAGIDVLKKEYSEMRQIRGDGNCYYRAFLYSLIETIVASSPQQQQQQQQTPSQHQKEGERILSWLKNESWNSVLAVGYDAMTIEIFHEAIVELLEKVLSSNPKLDWSEFHKEMNEENGTSDYCTWYMRVVTATHLKLDPARFLPFAESAIPGLDIAQYCAREVEPMGKECEMLQALALAEAFGVQVQIEYLDGHDMVNGKLVKHVVGKENAPLQLNLLYRPGHYDILYPKQTG